MALSAVMGKSIKSTVGRYISTAGRYNKKIIATSIICVVLYTIAYATLAAHQIFLPDALTYCFYGYFGFENGMCALIKTGKIKSSNNTTTNEEAQG